MPLTDHLRKIIPGAICAAIGGMMLLIGGIFYIVGYSSYQQMMEIYAEYAQYGMGYSPPSSGILPFSIFLLVFGFIFLAIGLGFIAKGVSIYRNPMMRRHRLEAEEKRLEIDEEEDEEEPQPVSPPSVNLPVASQCPRCGEILLDTMDTCPSCHRPIETRRAMPSASSLAADPVVQDKNYCMYCGNRLPDTPDLVFCPICGKKVG